MPLTAAEVRETRFATTRVRAGYDMDEVDAFLDIVEADVAQYADELQRSRDGEAVLRTQCDQLQLRLTVAEQRLRDVQAELVELQALRDRQPVPVEPVPAEATLAPQPVVAELSSPADISELVADDPEARSVLALAQSTADEMIRFAQARAANVRAAVRTMLTEQLALVDAAEADPDHPPRS